MTTPLQSRAVLVVDDFGTMRRIIGGLLKQLGCARVVEAENGSEAWRQLEAGHIDFVISDWNMPGMTGLELLRKLRSSAAFFGMPFLLVTAEGKKENVIEAAQAGADGYIVKPFTAAALGEKVNHILTKRGML